MNVSSTARNISRWIVTSYVTAFLRENRARECTAVSIALLDSAARYFSQHTKDPWHENASCNAQQREIRESCTATRWNTRDTWGIFYFWRCTLLINTYGTLVARCSRRCTMNLPAYRLMSITRASTCICKLYFDNGTLGAWSDTKGKQIRVGDNAKCKNVRDTAVTVT